MRKIIPIIPLFATLLSYTGANAQTDFSQLILPKGYISPGTGTYIDIAFPAPGCGNWWMIEPSMEYFFNYKDDYAFVFPILTGIRHVLNGKRHGFYVEPLAGYMFGSTTIPRTNAAGKPEIGANGDTVDQKGSAVMAGFGFGYLLPHSGCYSIELRYEHAFLEGHPQINILALRGAYTITFSRKSGYNN